MCLCACGDLHIFWGVHYITYVVAIVVFVGTSNSVSVVAVWGLIVGSRDGDSTQKPELQNLNTRICETLAGKI